MTKQELSELQEEAAELQRQNQALNTDVTDLNTIRMQHEATIDSLRRALENKQQQYDTTMENYVQQLTARTKELNEKEASFKAREAEFLQQQTALQVRQDELERQEKKTREALAAKERELEAVRTAVSKALTGFTDKGLNVETREGKVYVSMESKLMFPSASWTVSKEGIEAIKQIAKVLEQNPDLNIMVEGHTDNDAYKGSTAVKDNWDLSVMRATAIVKLLLKYGTKIDPARIEASGHGEYAPKVENNSAANKAQNRRTEIILTPKLDDILKAVNK